MPFCSQCGSQNSDSSKFCSQCGTPLAPPASESVPNDATTTIHVITSEPTSVNALNLTGVASRTG